MRTLSLESSLVIFNGEMYEFGSSVIRPTILMDVVKLFTCFLISRVILIAPLLTAGNLDNQHHNHFDEKVKNFTISEERNLCNITVVPI